MVLLAAMPGKARLPEFEEDREAALLRMFEGLPDAPDLSRAERVSDVIGTKDYPSITRRRIVSPGVALAGDAAMVGDPLWGVGCGFALQSGGWLADALAPALTAGSATEVDRALKGYARTHRRRLALHQKLLIDASSGRDFNLLERLIYRRGRPRPVGGRPDVGLRDPARLAVEPGLPAAAGPGGAGPQTLPDGARRRLTRGPSAARMAGSLSRHLGRVAHWTRLRDPGGYRVVMLQDLLVRTRRAD